MARLVVRSFSISIDGYGAGPAQDLKHPLGVDGSELHEWLANTRAGREAGVPGGDDDEGDGGGNADEEFATLGFTGVGAWIMGRNMFGPIRGPWPDEAWRGWWGEDPPFHVPVFVLTHYPRESLTMDGGTEFHFVTDGIRAALERAQEVAGERDIRLGGGAATIQQYLSAGLLDELHLAIAPTLLGRGENLFAGLDTRAAGYECAEYRAGGRAVGHVVLRKRA